MERFFKQFNFSSGLSDSDLLGPPNSFAESVGVDIYSEPGVVNVAQRMSGFAGGTIQSPVRWAILGSDGNSYWADNQGNIYRRTGLSGSFGTVYKDSNGTIRGLIEYNGFIYWATNTLLHRKPFPGSSNWSDAVGSWGTLNSATYHPMIEHRLYLWICDGRYIASIDDATGTLTHNGSVDSSFEGLPSAYQYSSIVKFGIDILLGTKVNDEYPLAKLWRWDTISPAPNSEDEIYEPGINAFLNIDDFVVAQCGFQGNIYRYDGSKLRKFKKIKGDYSGGKQMIVYPGATCIFDGNGYFGVSNLSGNPCFQGIYGLGRFDEKYPLGLTLQYPLLPPTTNNQTIGALLSQGTCLMAVGDLSGTGTAYEIDYTAKYSAAYLKPLIITGNREANKQFQNYAIPYKDKPSGADITLKYFSNHGTSGGTSITLTDKTGEHKLVGQDRFDAGAAQFQLSFTVSGNSAPKLEGFYCDWDEKSIL